MLVNTYAEKGQYDEDTLFRIRSAAIPNRFEHANLHKRHAKDLGEAGELCRQYASTFPQHKSNMVLAGSTGSGKTHMACATANETLRIWKDKLAFDVKFFGTLTTLPELLDYRFFRNREQYSKMLNDLLHADLLIVDDLLHVAQVEWAKEVLYRIYEQRYQNRLATITTLNVPKFEQNTDPFEAVKQTFNEPFMRRLVEDASEYTISL